jgi:hypothetical protein
MLPQGSESPSANDGLRRSTIDGRPPRTLHGEATRRGCAAVACPGRRRQRAGQQTWGSGRTSSQRKAARSARAELGGAAERHERGPQRGRTTAEGGIAAVGPPPSACGPPHVACRSACVRAVCRARRRTSVAHHPPPNGPHAPTTQRPTCTQVRHTHIGLSGPSRPVLCARERCVRAGALAAQELVRLL